MINQPMNVFSQRAHLMKPAAVQTIFERIGSTSQIASGTSITFQNLSADISEQDIGKHIKKKIKIKIKIKIFSYKIQIKSPYF